MSREYKSFNFRYSFNKHDKDQDHLVEGLGNVFNVVDGQKDVVLPGAMKRSLLRAYKQNMLPAMLLEHQVAQFAGLWYVVEEKDNGLFVSGKVLSSTEGGQMAIRQLYNRTLVGLSIGYKTISSYEKDGIRYLEEIDLQEVSLTENPANSKALIEKFEVYGNVSV